MVKQVNSGIQKLSDVGLIEFISSGIPELDSFAGGFPRARMTELVGPEGIGKSTVVSKCAIALSKSGKVLYIDAEQALNPQRLEQLGANLEKIDYTASYELESVADMVLEALPKYDAIIIDSIAVLVPKVLLEGNISDANIAVYSRQMAKFMKKLKPALGKSKCALIIVNQWRQSPDMFKPRYIPGGMAYNYALDFRIELATTPSKDKIVKEGERVGHWITAKVTKSKVCRPFQESRFKIMYKEGG